MQQGHPGTQDILAGSTSTDAVVTRGGVVPEPQPPLANGSFVNFESPQVKPLALNPAGTRLFATNTPNNTLLVIDTTTIPMQQLAAIPVGLDPVSVAVQPGTNGRIVWVANFISDNVSIVDVALGTVAAVVEVGDEPVSILFDAAGTHAFVVIQGSPPAGPGEPIVQEGALVAIDTTTLAVVDNLFLDSNRPRAAAYNPATNQVIVAALHSGNNTTVVGEPIVFNLAGGGAASAPFLLAVQLFSQTTGIFAASPELGPVWPDVSSNPTVGPSPLVQRIVSDSGGGWQQVVAVLSIDDGMGNLIPDPAMVAQMNLELGITNAAFAIRQIIDDAKDTLDHDLIVVDVSDPAGLGLNIVNMLGGVGTTLTGMGINSSGELFVANMEPRNTVRLEPGLRGHIVDHEIVIVINPQIPAAFVLPTDLHAGIPNFNDASQVNPLAQLFSLANPTDIVFDGDRPAAFVASLGVGRVAALDGFTASVLGRVDVGRGPRGLALDSAADLLYVMNRTDLTINRIDVSNPGNMLVIETLALFNPEPKVVKNGRDFLYSTRFTNNFASSCAVCHIDATLDHLPWDLGDPTGGPQPPPPNLPALANHPLKGPMVTLSLQGLDRHEPLHWRADKVVFQDFNGAFDGLLGGSQIPAEDMDAFAAFTKTIEYGPNPFRNRNDTFKDPTAAVGLNQFMASCNGCHNVNHGGALLGPTGDLGIILTGPPIFAQLQLVTQLRGIHKKFRSDLYNGTSLIHDGREERETTLPPVNCGVGPPVAACTDHPLCTFIRTFFQNFYCVPGTVEGVIAYCEAFPTNVKPVVGWQVKPSSPALPQEVFDINTMITQNAMLPSRCDVVVKGIVGGQPRGFVLIAADPGVLFRSDLGALRTLDDLLGLINSGASLVFTAVPPGSGPRIGVDQDADGLLDGLDPMPQINNDADVNLNGVADGDDLQPFLAVILNPNAAPDGPFQAADANNDGLVNLEDIDSVISILLTGGPF